MISKIITAIAVAGFFLVGLNSLGRIALAHPDDDQDAEWYQSLKRPDLGGSCCTGPHAIVPDCLPVESRQTADGFYEAYIDRRFPGQDVPGWVRVPPQKVLQKSANPVGRAVACWMPSIGILCFVRPADT